MIAVEIGPKVGNDAYPADGEAVLDAAGCKLAVADGSGLLAQPCHRPVEVMQLHAVGTGDGIVGHPHVSGPDPDLPLTTPLSQGEGRREAQMRGPPGSLGPLPRAGEIL